MTNTHGWIPPKAVLPVEACDGAGNRPSSTAPTTTWNSRPVPTHTGNRSSHAGTLRAHGRVRASTSSRPATWITAISAFEATHPLLWSTDRSLMPPNLEAAWRRSTTTHACTPSTQPAGGCRPMHYKPGRNLHSMAVRAGQEISAPSFLDPKDLRQFVVDTGRDQDPPSRQHPLSARRTRNPGSILST
jgi:hypothetical protein